MSNFHPQISLHFKKWNFLDVILGNIFYFLKRKLLLYFRKGNFFILQEISYILESNFLISKNRTNPPPEIFLIFREMKPSSSNIKKFLIFS